MGNVQAEWIVICYISVFFWVVLMFLTTMQYHVEYLMNTNTCTFSHSTLD